MKMLPAINAEEVAQMQVEETKDEEDLIETKTIPLQVRNSLCDWVHFDGNDMAKGYNIVSGHTTDGMHSYDI